MPNGEALPKLGELNPFNESAFGPTTCKESCMSASAELLLPTDQLPWVPLAEGIDFRLLYTSEETGRWTVLFRAQPGSFFGLHRHLGPGEYYVIKGCMQYRLGSAGAGTYGYEPLDAIHEHTEFSEYTELLFTNYGAVAFLDDKGAVTAILDQATLKAMAQRAN
jgi:hypothetical protein